MALLAWPLPAFANGSVPPDSRMPTVMAAKEAASRAEALQRSIHDRAQRIAALVDAGEIAKAQAAMAEQEAELALLKETASQAHDRAAEVSQQAAPAAEQAEASAADLSATDKKNAGERDKESVQALLEAAKDSAGCNGSTACLFGGLHIVGYSLTLGDGARSGQTGHHILEIAVPTIGFRKPLTQHISLDLGAYTAIVSPQFQLNTTKTSGTGCKVGGGKFEDSLPCEGNAALRPYIAGLIGFTAGTGSSTLGLVTVGLTGGVARTEQDASGFAFYGIMVSTGGIYATIPVGKTAQQKVREKKQ